jgi:hypothetical protein
MASGDRPDPHAGSGLHRPGRGVRRARHAAPDPVGVRIVTDAVEFCWLVASRLAPADLDLDVTGDPDRAAGVQAAASVLALD